jgi:hypothetical protein
MMLRHNSCLLLTESQGWQEEVGLPSKATKPAAQPDGIGAGAVVVSGGGIAVDVGMGTVVLDAGHAVVQTVSLFPQSVK